MKWSCTSEELESSSMGVGPALAELAAKGTEVKIRFGGHQVEEERVSGRRLACK